MIRIASRAGLLALGLFTVGIAAPGAKAQIVFSTDFNSGVPAQFSGAGIAQTVEAYAGLGPAGNQFSGNYLYNNTTGNPAAASTLTLTGLAPHTGITLKFLTAIIDSWDGFGSGDGPDAFNVSVNGTTIFSQVFAVASGSQTYNPAGVQIQGPVSNLAVSGYVDAAYNMGLDPTFTNIAHTSSTLTVSWFASGVGWQGGADESWAIDNVSVTLVGAATGATPEPSSTAALSLGVIVTGGWLRRRRSCKK